MNELITKSGGKILLRCSYDAIVKLSDLVPHPRNRNQHPKDQVERLAKIIGYQGIRSPIKVSLLSGCITAGHGRLLVAKKLGLKEFPVDYQDYENEDMEYADIQSDNAIALWAEFDLSGINADLAELGPFDIELLGIKDFVIEPLEKYDNKDADAVPDVKDNELGVKLGDIYQLGEHRLMCGDATKDVEVLMNGEKASTFFSDPPYGDNVGGLKTKNSKERVKGKGLVKRDKFIKNDENIDWLEVAFESVSKVLKKDSTKMVFFKWDKFCLIKKMAKCFGEPSACCVWDRVRKASAFFRFQPQHEFCFHWGNQADKKNKSSLSNVWRVTKELENNNLHPTVKPIDILAPAIQVTTSAKEIVLDVFGGSGSTLIACEKTNRKCYMCELDPHYVSVILKRWMEYTGKTAMLIENTRGKLEKPAPCVSKALD